jgi:predicted transcriptional regulator
MNLGDRSAAVLDLIESKGRITSADIASTLSITPEIAGTYLGRLVRSGRILKVGRGEWAALGVESVESVENPGSDQETLVPTVESVESVENLNTSTLSTGESRARTREDDIDNPDFQALWEMSWKEGTG